LLYVKRALLATVITVVMGAAQAAPVGEGATTASVPGEKIDNGLGSLPHFSKWMETWVYATPAESIDNGLGSLPPFSNWTETWVYATPAESIDNGLGSLPNYSLWNEPWVYAYPAAKIDSGLGEISPRAPALERAVAHAR
jgi:hypothetical protein